MRHVWMVIAGLLFVVGCGAESAMSGGAGGASTSSGGTGGEVVVSTTTPDGTPCPVMIGDDPCIAYTASFEDGVCVQHETPIACEDDLTNGGGAFPEGQCIPVVPGTSEDGSWARVVFGPWVTSGWKVAGVRFLAADGGGMAITNPWTIAMAYAPPGVSPGNVTCEVSQALPLTTFATFETNGQPPITVQGLEAAVEPYTQDIGGHVVVCLRETVDADGAGHPTGILMCGESKSCTDRDQWQTNPAAGSEVQQMSIYGAELCRPWSVELISE